MSVIVGNVPGRVTQQIPSHRLGHPERFQLALKPVTQRVKRHAIRLVLLILDASRFARAGEALFHFLDHLSGFALLTGRKDELTNCRSQLGGASDIELPHGLKTDLRKAESANT